MKLNADLSQLAVMHGETLPWVDSPLRGVQRRMLERDGEEVARATSIVRYAPNSYFSAHVHGGGEEFLVLEGIFSDEYGDYGPGTYVRNPPGSRHRPYSQEGCTIFVKLWQMASDEQNPVVLDTNKKPWRWGNVPGIFVMPLYSHATEQVTLEKWQPGTYGDRHSHQGGEELFVLEGTLEDENGYYSKSSWLRIPSGSFHTPYSRDGCILYLKRGHLGQGYCRSRSISHK